ncbi:MAG: hypothetical protein GY771_12730 [bacterium]|nr:hypothetical protein [bacterium]
MSSQISWCRLVNRDACGDKSPNGQGCIAVMTFFAIVDNGVTIQRFAASVELIAEYSQLQRISHALISKDYFSV